MSYIVVFLYFLVACTVHRVHAAGNMGPADIEIERIEDCEQPDLYSLKLPIQMQKLNRSHAGFSTCIELVEDVGKTTSFNMSAAKWGDGGWKPNALNFYEVDMCNVLEKYIKKTWIGIKKAIGLENKPCPIPKNKYCVDKLALELKGLFPSMLYGKFRLDMIVLWADEPKICIRAYVNSVPTKSVNL